MKPVVLVILDGWGVGLENKGNAVANAVKPNFDFIEKNFPFVLLQASGVPVGLPWGEPGNSEVGHTAMGTGQIWHQPLTRITLALQNGTFFQNPVLKKAAMHAKENNSTWHLVGLLGSGSVHSYIDHVYGLVEMAKNENVSQVWLHLFTDGRDSPPKESATAIKNFSDRLDWLKAGKVTGVIGRFYGMDRDLNWARTEKAYRLITESAGEKTTDFSASIKKQYEKGTTDEFIEPLVLADAEGKILGEVKDNDVIIFFNFREDSARQLARAFAQPNFKEFAVKPLKNIFCATLTHYENGLAAQVIFPSTEIKHTLSGLLSENKKTQFKIAETEKYAHVTYFFNGGEEKPYDGEERKLIKSDHSVHFNEKPEMKAREIGAELIASIKSGRYDFLLANFANADMMGHTGDYEATLKGVKVLDEMIGQIMATVLEANGTMLITADHGNADQMINTFTGEIFTEHTINPVPFYLISNETKKTQPSSDPTSVESTTGEKTPAQIKELKNPAMGVKGILQDVSATVLDLLRIPVPADMDGQSLLPILYK